MPRDQVVLLDTISHRLRDESNRQVQEILVELVGYDPEEVSDSEAYLCYSDFIGLVASVEIETHADPTLKFAAAPIGALLNKLMNLTPKNRVRELQFSWDSLDAALGGMAEVMASRGDASSPLAADFTLQLIHELEALLIEIELNVTDANSALTLRRAVEQLLRAIRRAALLGPSEMRKGAFEAAQTLHHGATRSGQIQPKVWRDVGALATALALGLAMPPAIESGVNLIKHFANDTSELVVNVDCGWHPPELPSGVPEGAAPQN